MQAAGAAVNRLDRLDRTVNCIKTMKIINFMLPINNALID